MRWSNFARSSTEVWLHVSNALRAALTALSTSSVVHWGIVPITSSVVALKTSIVSEPDGDTHAPSM
jgi:hypothetical protein